ncbi:mechanosensitive ion channel family protein [Aestuariicoccus sp. MJ-SS9]|uniref:mechanosensitive ion channel family protein n=1 Tax=Aestuariicoccus sp. MJ-SS9 TaxID=3079855 RepID=UPI002906E909|nr:mechanosensitive ion channel family protein [Aestuariicoccus sp. MJ-SS9]MDU8909977.1 mechanosensitive ion channel family protein [Aestuariicoccus sp. MJ-SS9]
MVRLILVCLCLLIGQAALSQEADQPSGTITIDDSAARDAAIAVRIREILAQLEGYDDVTVSVSSGIVTLRGTTLDSAAVTRLNALAGRVEGVVAIENEVTETADVVRRLDPAVDRFVNRARQFVAFLPLVGVALAAFLAVVFIGFFIARWRRPWDRLAPNAFISDIYRQVIRLAFMVGGVVVALDILGAAALLSTILGAAGIIGLAIGFAVRDTVENFIASIMLSIRQPFRPNDTVEIEGDTGKVIRLTSRATILLSFDGNHIRIPNATVFKSRIVNFSRNDERRFVLDLGVAYDTDLAAAQALALETVQALPFVLTTPAPAVWLEELGDSAVILRVAAWIAQHETSFVGAKGEAYRMCLAAFDAAGIEMPGPTYTVQGLPADKPAPAPRPAPAIAPAEKVEVQEVKAAAEQELEQIIETERAETKADDLLSPHGPEE